MFRGIVLIKSAAAFCLLVGVLGLVGCGNDANLEVRPATVPSPTAVP